MQLSSLITAPLRFARRVLLPLFGVLVILLAVLLSVARLALPLFDEQARNLVERAAYARGLALTVERLSLDWEGLGPRLSLHNTRIQGRDNGLSDATPLELQTLSLHFDLPQSLLSGQLQFDTLELRGLVLHLQRDQEARWGLSSLSSSRPPNDDTSGDDISGGAAPASWPAWMGMARRVVLSQSQLHLVDEISGLKLDINALDALFEQGTSRHGEPEQRFVLKMQLPESLGGMIELRAHLQGTLADLTRPSGELWLHTPQLKLPGWRALFASLPNGDLALPVALSDLPQLKTGELAGQTWLSLQQGALTDIQASLDFNDVLLKRPQLIPAHDLPPSALLAPLASHVNIHLQHHDTLWTLDLDTAPEAGGVDQRRTSPLLKNTATDPVQRFSMRREGDILALAAAHIDLSLLRPWLIATPILPEAMRRTLQRHRPLGMVQEMRLQLDLSQEPPLAQGNLRVTDFGWQGNENLPGVTGLDAQAWLDGRRALLRLASEDISVDSAGHVRERLRFKRLQGDIALFLPNPAASPDTSNPRSKLAIRHLQLNNPDLELALDLRLDLPANGSPLIDARGSLDKVPTERVPAYLPVKVLEKDALTWLDLALAGSKGFVPHAAIRLHGALDQFPYFPDNSGHFGIIVDFEHLNLNYAPLPAPGWPAAENLYGQLSFINNGFSGIIQSGQLKGLTLDKGILAIPSYDHPRLALELNLHGQSEHMLDVLKHSPLFKSPKDLEALKLSGAAKLDLNMGIRLDHRDPVPDRVEGWYAPHHARLQTFGLDFTKLNGTLHFVNLDFDSDTLSAELKQSPVSIKVKSQLSTGTAAAERGYHIELATTTQLSDWLQPALPILQKLPGRFPLDARLILSDDPLNQSHMNLDLRSDLAGLSINLPAPLHKSADAARPSEARLSFTQGKLSQISLRQPGQLEGQFKLGKNGISSANVHLGASDEGQRKEFINDEIMLSGTLDQLNLDEWLTVCNDQNAQQDSALPATLRISSKIQHLHALGGDWEKVAVDGTQNAQGWNIELDAPRISGQLIYPTTPSVEAPVEVKLSRLMFADAANAADEPQTDVVSSLTEPGSADPDSLDPGNLPPLSLHITELSYGDLKLHEIRLRAAPQAASASPKGEAAWIIQPLSAEGSQLGMQGSAAWRRTAEGHAFSTLALEFSSDDVGAALTGLGAKHALRKGVLKDSRIDLSWPGGLHQFGWGGAHGQGQFHILDGEIDKVELGAGRMLGLISLTELPRRLILDFGDVFGNGLHFDHLDSEMTLNDGLLNTQRFELASSALKLKVTGYSNMLDQSLHYQMAATPSLGNVLPIVGVVAGGPIIGGATFVAQKLFEMAGGSFVTLNYQITGTWDNPLIERGNPPEPTETPGQSRGGAAP